MQRIIIVGGGFAGFWAAVSARNAAAEHGCGIAIDVIDAHGFLTFRPRLHEAFSEDLRTPLRPLLAPLDIGLVIDEVTDADPARRAVVTRSRGRLEGDALVLAAGSVQQAIPVPGAAEHAFDIDTYDAAARFDLHLQSLYRGKQPAEPQTFVIVGAGFTGIEIACEMRRRIRVHAPASAAEAAQVVLVEQAPEVGPRLGPGPAPVILEALSAAGVEVLVSSRVRAIKSREVELESGRVMRNATTVVTSGLVASPLAKRFGAGLDALGRLDVDEYLQVRGRPCVFAAGDAAHAMADPEHAALMSCQHATIMGRFAGHNVVRLLSGLSLTPYSQPNYQTCLDLGDHGAVLTRGWDRTVVSSGAQAKAVKEMINRRIIVPKMNDPAALLAASSLPT